MKPIEKMNINPEHARELWHALFAVTHAIECLGYHEDVNGLRNDETGMGAWEYARNALALSVIREEE
tara:strand:- start:84 stop:284 length:201 start_codon:yes stop_codon:yes gene_type:complete